MSERREIEALARVLVKASKPEGASPFGGYQRAYQQAERILSDPGPLLDALPDDALIEALVRRAVLTEVYSVARHTPQPDMSGRPQVQRAGESTDRTAMEMVASLRPSEERWVERRLVTAWQEADR